MNVFHLVFNKFFKFGLCLGHFILVPKIVQRAVLIDSISNLFNPRINKCCLEFPSQIIFRIAC